VLSASNLTENGVIGKYVVDEIELAANPTFGEIIEESLCGSWV
jgi:hypothetical protein